MTPAPITAPHELRPALRLMLQDLECERLEVLLINAPEGRVWQGQRLRVVQSRNPSWYREMCASYPRYRRHRKHRFVDPRFKRADVVDVIQRLPSSGTRSYLAWPLLCAAKAQLQPENFPFDLVYDLPADLYAAAGAMEATL